MLMEPQKSKTTKTKLYVPIITLSSKDNLKLIKLSEEGFNRSVYWNEYQTKIKTKDLDNNNFTRLPLDSYQYFKDHFKLIAIDLSKQKELDSD